MADEDAQVTQQDEGAEAASEAPKEKDPKKEASPDKSDSGKGEAAKTEKVKKINRLSPEELEKRIQDLEGSKQTQSVYYRHLIMRRNELQPAQKD